MARKGILTPGAAPAAPRKAPKAPAGTVGALQSSLARLSENAVQEIDPALVDVAGFEDRLGMDEGALAQLTQSIRAHGQQVPVLLRPHPSRPGRYEIVYGRRRLMAAREIGAPLKAMVRQMDDQALAVAQGQENTARQDLSFIERASFAAQLDGAGYDRRTLADALSVDLPMVSRMLKVGRAFPLPVLRQIGPAPSVGRSRWMELARLFEDGAARGRAERALRAPEAAGMESDARFEAALAAAADTAKPSPAPERDIGGGVRAKRTRRALTLTVGAGDGFADWLDANAEDVVAELRARWREAAPQGNPQRQGSTKARP